MKKKIAFLLLFLAILTACNKGEVLLFTDVETRYTASVLEAFQAETGITVRVETTTTDQLPDKSITGKGDILWSRDIIAPLKLKEMGRLIPFKSEYADRIPEKYRDSEYYWTGFGGKTVVFLVNTEVIARENYPVSIEDLFNPQYNPSTTGFALPLSGIPLLNAAAFYHLSGKEAGAAFFTKIRERGIRLYETNEEIRDDLQSGVLDIGFLDSAIAMEIMNEKTFLKILYPGQEPGGAGVLVIPNTLALLTNGENRRNAKKMMEYLLNGENEFALIEKHCFQFSLRQSQGISDELRDLHVNPDELYSQIATVKQDAMEIFRD